MAGSYRHVVADDGSFRGTELLDGLGDAYEALEEFYNMIQYLTGGDKVKIHEAWKKGHVAKRYPRSNEQLFTYERFWVRDEI